MPSIELRKVSRTAITPGVGESDDFRCRYEGPDCNMDIDECLRQTVTCPANAGCINTEGAYNCTCWPGFTSTFCETRGGRGRGGLGLGFKHV